MAVKGKNFVLFAALAIFVCFLAETPAQEGSSGRTNVVAGSGISVPLEGTEWEGEGSVKIKIKNKAMGINIKEITHPLTDIEFESGGFEVNGLLEDGVEIREWDDISGTYFFDPKNKLVLEPNEEELSEFVEDILDVLDDDFLEPIVFSKIKIKAKFKISKDPLVPPSVSVQVAFAFQVTLEDGSIVKGKFKSKHRLYLQD